ncbi:MAG TPA: DinB family protein [Stackebrandtia sp.]|jgi:hypothetical protein|uniref:DinB family protein n=1 Tax=Stackebrandtia sp. TaxID=2023065 RepID=UPI002D331F14|nr:DinB family protein [Stackebrandtia sp.]HZE37711.1 DinB family protein [Stackebrandtia sp.]
MTDHHNQEIREATFADIDVRGTDFHDIRVRGAEFANVHVSGRLTNVTVNGVDIGPLVEAELDRRMPERARMRPTDPEGFREAWGILRRLWDGTVARAARLDPAALHRGVDGEWSFIETLRHLNFASAVWVGRMVLGDPSPWHPWDLPWDEASGWDGVPWDREVRPSLDEVLAVRRQRQAMVGGVLESLTRQQLDSRVTRTEPGWPRLENFPLSRCLRIVLNEEWEHRLYAERDLAKLDG